MADTAMDKNHSIFNGNGDIYKPSNDKAQPFIIQTHYTSSHGYDEYLYIYIARRFTKVKPGYYPSNSLLGQREPIDQYIGHCYWMRSINNVGYTPGLYYGSILQPCDDLSCVVAFDPWDPPTEYTCHTDDSDLAQYQNNTAVSYDFGWKSDEGANGSYRWDTGAYVNTAINTNNKLNGNTAEAGGLYVLRLNTAMCFDIKDGDDEKELEIFYLDPSYA